MQQNLDTLIQLVIREVLAQTKQPEADTDPGQSKKRQLYVIKTLPGTFLFAQTELYRRLDQRFDIHVMDLSDARNAPAPEKVLTPACGDAASGQRVLLPSLSGASLAKSALGISDTPETEWIAYCFRNAITICALQEGLPRFSFNASKHYVSLFASYERIVRGFGLRIVGTDQLLNEIRVKNHVITAGDLSGADEHAWIEIPEGAVVTTLAKEEIRRKHMHIKTEMKRG
ncbi:hypothetical protein NIE88_01390 [Sporolactobacillus shoreicorticis]|uniref:Ethanolamine utilization protein n=1 Tax=Sporolactobacillus shoreicorticis TaxID=1923877 RepID=A0ABW5S4L1_9BACL|nr:hypothetical protein [Sporolactobacillus shoreicorticis]MCO7124436.1 hypothetical protein [Sporolactobacillus shoreicorticis]